MRNCNTCPWPSGSTSFLLRMRFDRLVIGMTANRLQFSKDVQ